MNEIEHKLHVLRSSMQAHGLASLRLRGSDWFAWATGGASNIVLSTVESGIAELFITEREAYYLTDTIEAPRLLNEELATPYLLWSGGWEDQGAREAFVHDHNRGGLIASDRPRGAEHRLPHELYLRRRELVPEEITRYRQLGLESAQAMREALEEARPDWTEWDLAAAGGKALLRRGIDPALILAAGDRRMSEYRHPIPKHEKIGDRAMLVFCARRQGLFANLTRFVYFRPPTPAQQKLKEDLAAIEHEAWQASLAGNTLAEVYQRLVTAYKKLSYVGEYRKHHQGGPTGYGAREAIATPDLHEAIRPKTAVAWNPSLSGGGKIEDTVLIQNSSNLDILTADRAWPSFEHRGYARPDFLVHT